MNITNSNFLVTNLIHSKSSSLEKLQQYCQNCTADVKKNTSFKSDKSNCAKRNFSTFINEPRSFKSRKLPRQVKTHLHEKKLQRQSDNKVKANKPFRPEKRRKLQHQSQRTHLPVHNFQSKRMKMKGIQGIPVANSSLSRGLRAVCRNYEQKVFVHEASYESILEVKGELIEVVRLFEAVMVS
jgi:hypothetical protein